MKFTRLYSLIGLMTILLTACSKPDDPKQEVLIAHYPLVSDAVDITGLNGNMKLENTPFQNGGIYCNGKYVYGDPDYCHAMTPSINSLDRESFSASMDFFVTVTGTQPVWIIGAGCRWLGFYLKDDGTIALLYNNWDFIKTSKTYSLSEWHNAKISYTDLTAKIFLDNELAATLKFGNGYVELDNSSCGINDNEIGVTNFSNGAVFKGYVRDLKVYNIK